MPTDEIHFHLCTHSSSSSSSSLLQFFLLLCSRFLQRVFDAKGFTLTLGVWLRLRAGSAAGEANRKVLWLNRILVMELGPDDFDSRLCWGKKKKKKSVITSYIRFKKCHLQRSKKPNQSSQIESTNWFPIHLRCTWRVTEPKLFQGRVR